MRSAECFTPAKRKGISASLRFSTLEKCGFRCHYCGIPASRATLEVDHVLPVAAGGTNDPANLVAACDDCNAGKASRLLTTTLPVPDPVTVVVVRSGQAIARRPRPSREEVMRERAIVAEANSRMIETRLQELDATIAFETEAARAAREERRAILARVRMRKAAKEG